MIITSSFESIYAIHDGIIENINFINPIVGVVIIIRHDDDYFSVYNGNIEVSVMKGSVVKPGQKIGSINKNKHLNIIDNKGMLYKINKRGFNHFET